MQRTIFSRLTGGLLIPLTLPYRAAIALRNARYDRGTGVLRAAVPVISVGNITTGGTGKTPFVIELVQRLIARGRKPAVLTRGYGAAPGQEADEVLELRAALPATPVVVDADRVRGARTAIGEHAADCVVLDDGFQHRRLHRDLDIVLIDALNPWGGGRLLPAGRLREPLKNLCRAGLIVISRVNQTSETALAAITARLEKLAPSVARVRSELETTGFADSRGVAVSAATLAGVPVVAVCGLGNPQSFLAALAGHKLDTRRQLIYSDHHHYTRADVESAMAAARSSGATCVVTSRKDAVKLAPIWPQDMPLMRLDIRSRIAAPHLLDTLLDAALSARHRQLETQR